MTPVELAARAWNATKAADDPEFNSCAPVHRQNLVHTAESVIRARGLPPEPTAFESAVQRLIEEEKKGASAQEAKAEAIETDAPEADEESAPTETVSEPEPSA